MDAIPIHCHLATVASSIETLFTRVPSFVGACLFVCVRACLCVRVCAHGRLGFRVVCYVQAWAHWRAGSIKFIPAKIDTTRCTHVVYYLAELDTTSLTIIPHDSGDPDMYVQLLSCPLTNPALSLPFSTSTSTITSHRKIAAALTSGLYIDTLGLPRLQLMGVLGLFGVSVVLKKTNQSFFMRLVMLVGA